MTEQLVPEFMEFGKIPRLSRPMSITEKLDGTNGQIFIGDNGEFMVGGRNRWLTLEQDHYGFCRWAMDHKEELLKLGTGRHFGEWWGQGVQRGYGLNEKRFSLFNTSKWSDPAVRPACCHVVPVILEGLFSTDAAYSALAHLVDNGSLAAPGFKNPEGIIIVHVAGNLYFKKTIHKDEEPKGKPTA